MDFFWELATLILIMLLGHWIEMKSIAGASKDLELLVKLMPDDAHMVHGHMIMDVKTDTLKENDIVLVKPGEKVAADGMITGGESYLNESLLTGESKPVEKNKGDKVIAGSINGNGAIRVLVLHGVKGFLSVAGYQTRSRCGAIQIQDTIAGGQRCKMVNR